MNNEHRILITWALFTVIAGMMLVTMNSTVTHWGFFVVGLVGYCVGAMATGHVFGVAQGIKQGKAEGFVLGYDRAKREDYQILQRAQQGNQQK